MNKLVNGTLRSLLAAGILVSYPAIAAAASATFTVNLHVGLHCLVAPQGDVVANDGMVTAGTVVEACNRPGGYTITANYRAMDADEQAVLQYDGANIDLPHDGQVVLRVSNVATIRQVAYAFQTAHLHQPLALSLSIVPV